MTLARACSVLGLLVLAALLAGCTSQDGGTPSPTASPTSSVFVLDHATPSSTATREPVVETVELTHTAWLIDLASGDVHTIHEDPDAVIWRAEWSGDTARIYSNLASEGVAFTRDGDEAEVAPVPHACEQVDDHVVIDGVEYPEIGHCYLFSPSGRYVPYSVDADEYQDPRGLTLPRWDQWILDLETGGRTMVQAGLVHCGGCDAMFGMSWSPDERYLVVADLAAEERVFLVDLERGTSRVVAHGGAASRAARLVAQRPRPPPRPLRGRRRAPHRRRRGHRGGPPARVARAVRRERSLRLQPLRARSGQKVV